MKKMLVGASLVAALVYSAQAYEVYCNFGTLPHSSGTITTDTIEYKVVVGATSPALENFYVGYFIAPTVGSYYVKDSVGGVVAFSLGLSGGAFNAKDSFVADNSTMPANNFTVSSLNYALTTALEAGTYYFGYKVASDTYQLVETGWKASAAGDTAESVWNKPVSGTLDPETNGFGPVHTIVTVPEPTSCALLGLGAALLALRRRAVKA